MDGPLLGTDRHASAFYRHYGFETSPTDDLTLLLVVNEVRIGPRG